MPLKLSEKSLRWALQHALRYGDSDVLPPAFEFHAIANDPEFVKKLAERDLSSWQVGPSRQAMAPKHLYGLRPVVQLDPVAFLIYAATVFELGDDIERARVQATMELVHSHRFAPNEDGQLYSTSYTWSTFQQGVRKRLDSGQCEYIVRTDIADFYSRIYSHRLENALSAASQKSDHIKLLMSFLRQWNAAESHGIPIGPSPSRLLAEITLDDVDRGLLAEQVDFLRFNDDYVLFCDSERKARECLASLAELLNENHGLSLNYSKTKIMSCTDYRRSIDPPESEDEELAQLKDRWDELSEELGLSSSYGPIAFEDLDDEFRAEILELNVAGLLGAELDKEAPSPSTVRYLLNRLEQLNDSGSAIELLENINRIYVVFSDVMRYLASLTNLSDAQKLEIGGKILVALDSENSLFHLEFHRMWAFWVFGSSSGWDNQEDFSSRLDQEPAASVRRELVLALAIGGSAYLFRRFKKRLFELPEWERRAMLAGAGQMTHDEMTHWHRSIRQRLTPLEVAITRWVEAGRPLVPVT